MERFELYKLHSLRYILRERECCVVLDVKFYLVIIIIFFNLFDRTWLCSEYSTSVANLPMIYITKSSPQFRLSPVPHKPIESGLMSNILIKTTLKISQHESYVCVR